MDKKEHDAFMRGGIHQLTNEEALAVQTKRFKDGEIMLPKTFYTEDCVFHPRGDTYKIDLGKNDKTQMTTIKISRDFNLTNLEKEGITESILNNEWMKKINELCIKDTQDMYIRELMNRINRCIRWMEANRYNEGLYMDIPIAILKDDISVIEKEYSMFCKIKAEDSEYNRDGIEILAEIMGDKNGNY